MKLVTSALLAVCVALWVSIEALTAAGSCESLSSLKLPDTTITMASRWPQADSRRRPPEAAEKHSTGCRPSVASRRRSNRPPTRTSKSRSGCRHPVGTASSRQSETEGGPDTLAIRPWRRPSPVVTRRRPRTPATARLVASFAFGHPEKLIDYAYRSEHEMTVKAKAIINAFYGNAPTRSYFNGCSTGGRQALTEASRFPDDFDGIIAGAAANPKTRLDTWRIWMGLETMKDPATRIPQEKYPAIHRAVLAACDALDGLEDGLIDDPTRCRFDAHVLACKEGDGPSCLTPKQVQAVNTILGPAKSPRTGAAIFPGYQPGTELQWGRLIGGPEPYDTALDQFRIVFNDPKWDWRTFDVDRDLAKAEESPRAC